MQESKVTISFEEFESACSVVNNIDSVIMIIVVLLFFIILLFLVRHNDRSKDY